MAAESCICGSVTSAVTCRLFALPTPLSRLWRRATPYQRCAGDRRARPHRGRRHGVGPGQRDRPGRGVDRVGPELGRRDPASPPRRSMARRFEGQAGYRSAHVAAQSSTKRTADQPGARWCTGVASGRSCAARSPQNCGRSGPAASAAPVDAGRDGGRSTQPHGGAAAAHRAHHSRAGGIPTTGRCELVTVKDGVRRERPPPRHLPAGAATAWRRCRPRRARSPCRSRSTRRHRAVPAGHRGRGVFLHPGSTAEHHQVRERVPRDGRPLLLRRQPPVHRTDDGTGFDTATTRHGTGLQGWPIGWPRSAALSTSAHGPGRERPSAASSRFPHLAEPGPFGAVIARSRSRRAAGHGGAG